VILGVLDKDQRGDELRQRLLREAGRLPQGGRDPQVTVWANRHLALCSIPPQIDTSDETPQPFINEDRTVVVLCEGKIHNAAELRRALGSKYRFRTDCSGEVFAHLYETDPQGFLDRVNGKFAFALWDERNQKLILGRDRLGIEPLFYHTDGTRLIFGSSLRGIFATGCVRKELNHQALLQYLLYCYNPGAETLLRNVYKLPAGHILSCNGFGIALQRYWRLSFAEPRVKTEAQYREEILNLIEDAIRIRLETHRPLGALLSGGTDSSTIVSLASRMCSQPLRTFSFRCEGRTYDESRYARLVAQRYGSQHTEIPYRPEHLTLISEAVAAMDEPFCDIGIEIGTYLLGQAAAGQVSYVFSGEGGDELFGGHPVYIADKLAAIVDHLPQSVVSPLARALQRIPDSDQKNNLQVKLKRFAYSLAFPPELLSHRWRIYYTPAELRELCTEDFLEHCDIAHMFDSVLKHSGETDGRDLLSRSLYSDYHTLVDFYLRRLGLLRTFSIESRLPFLDHRLVEYAAQVPARLKIRRLSETKYIYKKALESVLPEEILYNRPKLGHSVPMKNWLRHGHGVREWVVDVLSEGAFKDRGLFRTACVQRLVDEHARKTHNHSHRLWGLTVLGLWLKSWLDS
jgi:asparagine synthase (glutamine-hydrolysing)